MSVFNNISNLTQTSKYLVAYEINFCEMLVIKLKQRLSSVVFEMTDLSRNMRAPHPSLACEKNFPVSFLVGGRHCFLFHSLPPAMALPRSKLFVLTMDIPGDENYYIYPSQNLSSFSVKYLFIHLFKNIQ